mmetsp:Transcript_16297/g.33045  ORF Transcript_16297/g.33045 Transcript_16297/m.33045 type:complete len:157 (+) Transcript_16297:1679-2149(+)
MGLFHELVVGRFNLTECASGQEGSGQVTGLGVVQQRQICQKHHGHDGEHDQLALIWLAPVQDFVFDELRQPSHGASSEDDQKADTADDWDEILNDGWVGKYQYLEHGEQNQSEDIIDNTGCHDELSDGCIQHLPTLQGRCGDSQRGGTEGSTNCHG